MLCLRRWHMPIFNRERVALEIPVTRHRPRNALTAGEWPHPYLHKTTKSGWFWRRQIPLITRPARAAEITVRFTIHETAGHGVRAQTVRVNAARKSPKCVLTRAALFANRVCISPAKEVDDGGDGGRVRVLCEPAHRGSHKFAAGDGFITCFVVARRIFNLCRCVCERASERARPPGRMLLNLDGVCVVFQGVNLVDSSNRLTKQRDI